MDLTYTAEDEAFRADIRSWLHDHLTGEFAEAKGLGGPGREHEAFDVRVAWDRHLAAHGWTCLDWPKEYGGRAAGVAQQVIFHEEYARADAPIRVSHIGEQLLGPTLIAYGTEEQKQRFLPGIRSVTELWCQGYSEPDAGSDLANVKTTAVLSEDGTEWILNGQKVWTSLAHLADWCFVLARTDPSKPKHRGLSYLLVPMKQPGVEVRPILQLNKTSEFNEVYFTDARTDAANVVGGVDNGWKIAMATLGFERGVSTLGQQIGFRRELDGVIAAARANGALDDPLILDRLTRASIGLDVMRLNALRSMTGLADGTPGPEASIAKLVWARWHRDLGELAMDVLGVAGTVTGPDYDLDEWQRLWLFSRADTIYGGSDEIQRTVIAERVLGLPKEPRA
ncbi:acyl-CoA dehydrogenase family protein [Catenulispora rubra]|uniref:acyl-CoA dehydrogenase family protein n=1 Tax=Catenulispora rubra TaxID=280293 RepID=UPI00189249AC|nr:acyl-CoA dehydrogenase family protein [Catenulispora rubra]